MSLGQSSKFLMGVVINTRKVGFGEKLDGPKLILWG